MSDDEEVVANKPKLTKKGRNTLADSSSSEDDDLFGSDNDDESEVGVADSSYSKEKLKTALDQVKTFIDRDTPPPSELPLSLESWEDAEKMIEKKQLRFSDAGSLVNFLDSMDGDPSLELKCFVAAVALQTCRVASRTADRASAQSLFKSKVKADKSKHIGNFVSNTWLHESLQQLSKAKSVDNTKANMHIHILTTGLHFMEDCFVIDNEKKVNVLKEKQGIDWKGTASKILSAANTHKLEGLSKLATTIGKYLTDFNPAKKSPAAVSAVPTASAAVPKVPASVDSQVLQDAAKKKREERMKNLRKKASYTSTTVAPPPIATPTEDSWAASAASLSRPSYSSSAPAINRESWKSAPQPSNSYTSSAPTPSSSYPSTTAAAPPAPSGSYASTAAAPPAPSGSYASFAAPSAPATAADPYSTGGSTAAPAPAPSRGFNDSLPYNGGGNGRSWSGAGAADSASRATTTSNGGYDANKRSWNEANSNIPAAHDTGMDQSSWNNNNASYWTGVAGGDGGSGSGASAYPARGGAGGSSSNSYSSNGVRAYNDAPSSNNNNSAPSSFANAAGSGDASSGRGDRYYPGSSTADASAGSARDNQYAGGGGNGGGYDAPPRAGSYGAPPPQPPYNNNRSNDYDSSNRDNYDQRGRKGNKRPRQEAPPPAAAAAAFADTAGQSSGGGRGRGRTLPAWVTKHEDGPSSMSEPPSRRQDQYSNGSGGGGPPPPSRDLPPMNNVQPLQGTGRGRGRTLPAWMTQPPGGGDSVGQAAPEEPPRPRGGRGGEPRGPPPKANFDNASTSLPAGGRGRGRTLPAWMTQGGDNVGQSSEPRGGRFSEPRGPPPPASNFDNSNLNSLPAGGRGRGRTLPAWMTAQQNNGLGS